MPTEITNPALEAISFKQLKLFETLGRVKSIRQTADEDNLSQPAVTQALAKLEKLVDAQLVDRGARGSYLTDFGDTFLFRVNRFFDLFIQALCNLPVTGNDAVVQATSKRITRSQIRAIICLYDHTNVEIAAAELGLRDTSLIRAVKMLERNVGKSLLSHNVGGTALTMVGSEFARSMKVALQEINMGKSEMDLKKGHSMSRIVIGAMPLGGSLLLSSVLDQFLQLYPDIEFKVVSESAAELLKSLKSGGVDFVLGLVSEDSTDELTAEPIMQTPFMIVSRPDHPLVQKGEISTSDLLDYDWIIGSQGASRRTQFEKIFETTDGPRTSVRTSSFPIIRNLLKNSDRLALLTSYELMNDRSDLHALNFGPISPTPSIGIHYRQSWYPTKIQNQLLNMLRETAKELESEFTPQSLNTI